MGTLFGRHLAEIADVTILESNEAVRAGLESAGLRVNDGEPRKVRIAQRARELFSSDVLFLFVKAVDTLRALRPFAGELNPTTAIVSLQNGVGNEDAIKTALGGAVPVILGVTTESAASCGTVFPTSKWRNGSSTADSSNWRPRGSFSARG